MDIHLLLNEPNKKPISKIHRKSTVSNGYLHSLSNYLSNYPDFIKCNIPRGQFIQASRMVSEEEHFQEEIKFIVSLFQARGHQKEFLEKTSEEIHFKRQELFDPILVYGFSKHKNKIGNSTTSENRQIPQYNLDMSVDAFGI